MVTAIVHCIARTRSYALKCKTGNKLQLSPFDGVDSIQLCSVNSQIFAIKQFFLENR